MHTRPAVTPIPALLTLTILGSVGTGITWNGITFIAKHSYGFDQQRNLWLYVAMGLTYIIGAFSAGKLSRTVRRKLTPRGLLAGVLVALSVVCLGPLLDVGEWILWTVACATQFLSSLLWPLVESYLTAGRHGRDARRAMGIWNVSWTTAAGGSLLLMAPLVETNAKLALVGLAPLYGCSLLMLRWFPLRPASHDETLSQSSTTPEYPLLLHSARVLLPVSYLLVGAMSPLMPYLLERIGVAVLEETPMTSTWMIVRVIAIAVMWRTNFWHGRWATLLVAGVTLAVGFAMLVAAPNRGVLLLGLAIFGAGQGMVYFAALYYAMTVGRAAVDAGGTHEGLIGAGYTAGPAITLIAIFFAGADRTQQETVIILTVCTATVLAAIPAVRPYVLALKRRG